MKFQAEALPNCR